MKQWGRWRGNTDSSGMESGLATCSLPLQLKFSLISTTIYFTSLYFSPFLSLPLYFSPLYHPPPPQLLFFLFFPSHPVHRERCFGSHVTFCPDTIAGVCHWPMFLWKSVGFPGDREWRHHFTFLCSCLPPPPPFCIALSWSLSVSPTGCGRSGSPRARHTQTVTVAVQLFLFSLFSFFIGQQAVTETIRLQEVSETNGLVCWDLAVFLPRSLHFLFVSFLVEHIASLVSSCTDNIQSKWKSPGQITHWSNNYSYKVSLCLSGVLVTMVNIIWHVAY